MTDPYGIIDLASLKQPAGGAGASAGMGEASAHEVAVTEQGLEQLVADSQRVPTLLVVTSGRVPGADTFLADLRGGANAHGGAVRLAIVDADTQPRVAAGLRVQQLPTLLLLMQGQIQPIVETVLPSDQVSALFDQIVQIAAQEGMPATGADDAAEPAPEPLSPLVEEAQEAIERGDLDAAISAFEKQLQQTPADTETQAALATVRLMKRTEGENLEDARQAAANAPEDLDAQLRVADLDMIGGHVEDAFARLLDLLRGADAEQRDRVRARLLELFEIAGAQDPRVVAARKRMANLLF